MELWRRWLVYAVLTGGNMRIGTLVSDTDIDKDIGIVVGHHTDIDGTIYNKVKWLTGNRSVSHCSVSYTHLRAHET